MGAARMRAHRDARAAARCTRASRMHIHIYVFVLYPMPWVVVLGALPLMCTCYDGDHDARLYDDHAAALMLLMCVVHADVCAGCQLS